MSGIRVKIFGLFLLVCLSFQAQDIRTLLTLAAQDDANAQFLLACRYRQGSGVKKDFAKAFHWFFLATELGHADAQNNLGLCYSNGMGVEKDLEKAVYHFSEAAAKNNAWAQFNLGTCYYSGDGTARDYDKAYSWFMKSAVSGNAAAQNKIGECYKYGRGVKQDYNKAIGWFLKAARERDAMAEYNMGMLYYEGVGVPLDLVKAVDWFTLASEETVSKKPYPLAQYRLGVCYKTGMGVTKDYAKAAVFFSKSATRGFGESQYELGLCYEAGVGAPQNYKRAYFWLKKASEQQIETPELLHYGTFSQFLNFYTETEMLKMRLKKHDETDEAYCLRLAALELDTLLYGDLELKAEAEYIGIKQDEFEFDSDIRFGKYDTDLRAFPVQTTQIDDQMVGVEIKDVEAFKNEVWPRLQKRPVFCIKNDDIGVCQLVFTLPEEKLEYKTFTAPALAETED